MLIFPGIYPLIDIAIVKYRDCGVLFGEASIKVALMFQAFTAVTSNQANAMQLSGKKAARNARQFARRVKKKAGKARSVRYSKEYYSVEIYM